MNTGQTIGCRRSDPPSHSIDLQGRGIDKVQAANLRERLATFAEDWESPEMDIYDNYDEEKAKLQTR